MLLLMGTCGVIPASRIWCKVRMMVFLMPEKPGAGEMSRINIDPRIQDSDIDVEATGSLRGSADGLMMSFTSVLCRDSGAVTVRLSEVTPN